MKRVLLFVLSCVIALALAACHGSGEKMVTLGFSQIGAESEWRTANSQSIRDEAEKQGIALKFSDAQQKQENQIKAIRSFIQQRVNVIAFSPVVETGWEPVLREAQAARIPVILTDTFRERLARADFFGYSFCSDEIKLKAGDYNMIFALYDQESGRVGTIERPLHIPEFDRSGSRITTALFGRAVLTEGKGKRIELSAKDGTLMTGKRRFYPMVGGDLNRGEPASLYIQLAQPKEEPQPDLRFDLTQEGYIVDSVPAALLEKHWDRKAGVWHLLFSIQFNRFTSGAYFFRLVREDPGGGQPQIKTIELNLR